MLRRSATCTSGSAANPVIWKGIKARSLLSFTIVVLVALVVAGTVVAVGFSGLVDVSRGSAGTLVLLGFVAIAAQSVESVRRREPELALARLRGLRGVRLQLFIVVEPAVIVLAGAVIGVAGGWLAGRAAVEAWLPAGTHFSVDTTVWTSVGLVTLATLVLVAATGWRVGRAPLVRQLAGVRRAGPTTSVGLFLQLVLVLGAVVAIYQSNQAPRSRVDWVTLVSPAVVGLAAGQILIWLILAGLAVVVPRSTGRGVGWFLTLRRLLRRADSMAVIRMVVAAGVVVGVAASAYGAAQGWREERAKLQVGAPVSYRIAGGALNAYAAAHQADPQGRWLLPVASYTVESDGASRRVLVDAGRWQAVVGDFYAGTSVAPLTKALDSFPRPPTSVYVKSDRISAGVTTSTLAATSRLGLTFQYVNDHGDLAIVNLPFRAGFTTSTAGGVTEFSRPITDCHLACSMVQLDVSGYAAPAVTLTDVTFAGSHLLAPGSGMKVAHDMFILLKTTQVPDGLALLMRPERYADTYTKTLGTFSRSPGLVAVTTPGLQLDITHGQRSVPGVDGTFLPVTVKSTEPVLPFVGTSGALVDLGTALQGAGGSIPDTRAVVLARSDTPPSVITALQGTGVVSSSTSYAQDVVSLGEQPRAQGTRLYLLIAAFAALIALISIGSSVAQQNRERRTEAASLRSVGVGVREVAGAYRREAIVLAVATFVGTLIGAWGSARVLLRALPLVSGWAFAPPLDVSPHVVLIISTALVAGIVVAVLTYVGLRGVGRAAPPRLLREGPS